MENEKILVDLSEVGEVILNMVTDESFNNLFNNTANQTEDYKQGAIFGATIAFSFINNYATKYIINNENMKKEISITIEYMEKQLYKHKKNLERALEKSSVGDFEISSIKSKIKYYDDAVIALKKYKSECEE